MSKKNPHEPGTIESTTWALLRPIRKEDGKRRKKTKGAFGKPLKGSTTLSKYADE